MSLADELIRNRVTMPKIDSHLYMAVLGFKKQGGGYDRARAILDRAFGRGQTNDDAGARNYVRESASPLLPAASSPQANGSGQHVDARPRPALPAAPVRPPLNLHGDVAMLARNLQAQSIFDRVRTSDGRAWGDVGAHELDGMARDGALAKAIKDKMGVLTNAQRFMKVRELLNAETFEKIRSEANAS